jgi:dTDP-4-dehydrorhamnose reductase
VTVLVIGRSGQLARALAERMPGARYCGRSEIDILDPGAVQTLCDRLGPTIIINAAAYTAVDQAEEEPDLAWQLNAELPRRLAQAAQVRQIPLIHVSSDYVFDGRANEPYLPDDAVGPVSTYGKSKLAGELAVSSLCNRHLILRTSWVFAAQGKNFVRTMLRLAESRAELAIVADQIGRPTWAGDLATLIVLLVDSLDQQAPMQWGIYHATGGPVVSWHDFAVEIFTRAKVLRLIDRVPALKRIPTADYPTPAPRPLRAVLAPALPPGLSCGPELDWRDGLDRVLESLAARRVAS